MDDRPYTIPEEDPFNIRPLLLQPRRKRSSMLNKWIQDQQRLPTNTDDDIMDLTDESSSPFHSGTRSNPYLAYPDLGTAAKHSSPHVSSVTLASFDLVEDDDIPLDIVPDVICLSSILREFVILTQFLRCPLKPPRILQEDPDYLEPRPL